MLATSYESHVIELLLTFFNKTTSHRNTVIMYYYRYRHYNSDQASVIWMFFFSNLTIDLSVVPPCHSEFICEQLLS